MITVKSPVPPANGVGDHVRLRCWCALDDLARHHCPLSRCTLAAPIRRRYEEMAVLSWLEVENASIVFASLRRSDLPAILS